MMTLGMISPCHPNKVLVPGISKTIVIFRILENTKYWKELRLPSNISPIMYVRLLNTGIERNVKERTHLC